VGRFVLRYVRKYIRLYARAYLRKHVRRYVGTNVSTSLNKSHFTYTPDIITVIILRCRINYLAKKLMNYSIFYGNDVNAYLAAMLLNLVYVYFGTEM